jgi:hypothetical protein
LTASRFIRDGWSTEPVQRALVTGANVRDARDDYSILYVAERGTRPTRRVQKLEEIEMT